MAAARQEAEAENSGEETMSQRAGAAAAVPNGRSARVPRVKFADGVGRAPSAASSPRTPGSKSSTFGLDIGGTLAKVVYFEPDDLDLGEGATRKVRDFIFHTTKYGSTGKREKNRCIYVPALRGTMHFIKFQTSRVPSAIAMMRKYGLYAAATDVFATGGARQDPPYAGHADRTGLTAARRPPSPCQAAR